MLDVVPALVIMLSAAVAGLSADIDPDHPVWQARPTQQLVTPHLGSEVAEQRQHKAAHDSSSRAFTEHVLLVAASAFRRRIHLSLRKLDRHSRFSSRFSLLAKSWSRCGSSERENTFWARTGTGVGLKPSKNQVDFRAAFKRLSN